MQLSANGTASQLTIHDFAFNGTPDGALNAGQMVGLENVNVEDKVSIKTTLNNATINVTPDLIGGLLQVVSINGQVVKSMNIADINTTIEFEGINSKKFDNNIIDYSYVINLNHNKLDLLINVNKIHQDYIVFLESNYKCYEIKNTFMQN